MNNSGPDIHADFRTILETLGKFGMQRLEKQPHHSVYYDYNLEWQKFCLDPNHKELKDCDCTIPDDHEGNGVDKEVIEE